MPWIKDPDEVGALWRKQSERGEYLTGYVEIDGERINVVCFASTSRNANAPAWRILRAKPKQHNDETPPF